MGQKGASTDYTREGENSEALEMCIIILPKPQKTCRQITKQNTCFYYPWATAVVCGPGMAHAATLHPLLVAHPNHSEIFLIRPPQQNLR